MSKPLAGTYRGYGPKDVKEWVLKAFRDRYGIEPAHIEFTGGGVLAGPIPDGEELRPGEHVVTGGVGEHD